MKFYNPYELRAERIVKSEADDRPGDTTKGWILAILEPYYITNRPSKVSIRCVFISIDGVVEHLDITELRIIAGEMSLLYPSSIFGNVKSWEEK